MVVDASALIGFLAQDAADQTATDEVVGAAIEQGFLAPKLLELEVPNALRKLLKRGRLTIKLRDELLADFRAMPVRLEPRYDLTRLVGVSDTYGLTVYDAAYLVLAMETSTPLATLDGPLADAAEAAGVPVALRP